jgi:hypothetical protein
MSSKSTPSGGGGVFMLRSRTEVNSTFGRRNISAPRAAALHQVAASGFVIGAGDRRQVDIQLRRQLALRGQAVARFQ